MTDRVAQARAETLWAITRFKDSMTPEELTKMIFEGPVLADIMKIIEKADEPLSEYEIWCYAQTW